MPGAPADRQRRAVTRRVDPLAAGLHADQLDLLVGDERREHADRVRAAADARDHARRQPPLALEQLRARLVADHALQVAHERRVGRRADDRADHVVGALDVRHPVADRRRGRLLERPRARVHRLHGRPEQLHPLHVRALAARVLHAHVDDALHPQQRAHGRGRDAVLAGAGLGDDPPLAHPLGEQHLPERVVELVRAGVVEVLALEVDGRPARSESLLARYSGVGRPPKSRSSAVELGAVGRVLARLQPCLLELGERRHQRLGHELPAVGPEAVLDSAHAAAPAAARCTPGIALAIGCRTSGACLAAPSSHRREERPQLRRVLVPRALLGAAGGVDRERAASARSPRRRSPRSGRR